MAQWHTATFFKHMAKCAGTFTNGTMNMCAKNADFQVAIVDGARNWGTVWLIEHPDWRHVRQIEISAFLQDLKNIKFVCLKNENIFLFLSHILVTQTIL